MILIALFIVAITGLLVLIIYNFRYRKHMMEMVYRDGLTNIYNRRFGDKQIYDAYAHGTRGTFPLSLIMIDIDNFSDYNNTFGHLSGDAALRCIAESISKNTSDITYRYGGEEFAIICSGRDLSYVEEIAENVRRSVEGLFEQVESSLKRKVTMSLGISIDIDATKNIDLLIKEADAALYKSKEQGKNRVTTYK